MDGVTSFGLHTWCGKREEPGYYTRVGDKLILDWIKTKLDDPRNIKYVTDLPVENKSPDCYAKNVDISSSWSGNNKIAEFDHVKNAETCQKKCSGQNCKYWVYQEVTGECVLYTDIEWIEHDDDKDEGNVMGQAEGCLPCFRKGWDYVKTGSGYNLVGKRAIHGVGEAVSCAKICELVPDCQFWRLFNNRTSFCNSINCLVKRAAEYMEHKLHKRLFRY